jgi:hypothetical protein
MSTHFSGGVRQPNGRQVRVPDSQRRNVFARGLLTVFGNQVCRMHPPLRYFLSALLLLVAVHPAESQDYSLAQLRAAPSEIKIHGRLLTLDAYLWRDFMPISPPNGKPLTATVRVQSPEGQSISDGLTVERAWFLKGAEVWSTSPSEVRTVDNGSIEVMFINGPLWKPGLVVDIAIVVRDSSGGRHLVSRREQRIERTE